VVYLDCPEFKLPKFELCPENFGHTFIALFGYQDIYFDASPEFSTRYLLRGQHESRIRKRFGSDLRPYLESIPEGSIEGHKDGLLIFRHRHRCRPEEAETLIRAAIGIAGRFAG
jgi:hypothetical protein